MTIHAEVIGTTTVTSFADEGSPVEVDEIEVTGHQLMLDGSVLFWRKPTAYTVKVSVIPGSANDESLAKLLMASKASSGSNGVCRDIKEIKTDLQICCPKLNKSGKHAERGKKRLTDKAVINDGEVINGYEITAYTEGRIMSGHPGVTVDTEGKIQAKVYTFVFENQDKVSKQ